MENVVSQKPMRLIWLDQLKAVSMYIVVLGHTLLDFNKHKLFKFIYSFYIPLTVPLPGHLLPQFFPHFQHPFSSDTSSFCRSRYILFH